MLLEFCVENFLSLKEWADGWHSCQGLWYTTAGLDVRTVKYAPADTIKLTYEYDRSPMGCLHRRNRSVSLYRERIARWHAVSPYRFSES